MSILTASETPSTRTNGVAQAARLGPGVVVAAGGAGIGLLAAHLTDVSSMLVAIVIGAVLANSGVLPESTAPGLAVVGKRVLRVGVALLGLQLVLGDIVALGAGMIGVIVSVVSVGILSTLFIGRWLGIGLTQRLLIACGFSICGAAAVAAADGVIEADESEAASAIGLVVLFGTMMIPVIPLAGQLVGMPDHEIGLWAGASIHEVAQVVAAGGTIGGAALSAAVLVKLGRVLMLAPVLAVVSLWMRRRTGLGATSAQASRPPVVPLFVTAFLALALLRSTGVVPESIVGGVHLAQSVALTMAMFSLGCGVRVAALRRGGAKPLVLAALSTVVVASTALAGITLLATP
ncbi:MAG: putative sulfate exporter family transporter [Intrasporangium sp.]|uniref:YeiH family protein n=1 Tax=Intrasporangium sp. TaxID=1925024 RepID=UPI0026478B92|nr:putative sulfate exporter family transporter [Intrasporangium sp.]MDN5795967.1 putative sulfate exporter family transporter [Intrasporangium sp.]